MLHRKHTVLNSSYSMEAKYRFGKLSQLMKEILAKGLLPRHVLRMYQKVAATTAY